MFEEESRCYKHGKYRFQFQSLHNSGARAAQQNQDNKALPGSLVLWHSRFKGEYFQHRPNYVLRKTLICGRRLQSKRCLKGRNSAYLCWIRRTLSPTKQLIYETFSSFSGFRSSTPTLRASYNFTEYSNACGWTNTCLLAYQWSNSIIPAERILRCKAIGGALTPNILKWKFPPDLPTARGIPIKDNIGCVAVSGSTAWQFKGLIPEVN